MYLLTHALTLAERIYKKLYILVASQERKQVVGGWEQESNFFIVYLLNFEPW